MKVFITCTPEFSEEILDNVVETLNQTSGVIEFIKSPVRSFKVFDSYVNGFRNKTILSSEEFFKVCEQLKMNNPISEDEYFVIISDKPHSSNWFSAFRGKNIFVDGGNWDHFTSKDSKYGISFQIAENLFQSLIDLKIEGELDPLIHQKSIGCVNDMCMDKKEITLKFFAGHICDQCYAVGKEKIKDVFILNHLESIFNKLRNDFVKRGESPEQHIPIPEVIDDTQIKIGNIEFKPQPLEKSIYIYFIKNKDGVDTHLIQEKAEDIYSIYRKIRKSAQLLNVANIFGYSVTPSNKLSKVYGTEHRFEEIRSTIKRKLKKHFGEELAKKYFIDVSKVKDDSNVYVLKCYL